MLNNPHSLPCPLLTAPSSALQAVTDTPFCGSMNSPTNTPGTHPGERGKSLHPVLSSSCPYRLHTTAGVTWASLCLDA